MAWDDAAPDAVLIADDAGPDGARPDMPIASKDAGVDTLARDSAIPDAPVIDRDARPDGDAARSDAAVDGGGREAASEGGTRAACTLALGGLVPLTTTGESPAFVAVGDLDRDGKLDVVTANDFDGTVSVLLGNGDGTFAAAGTYATGAPRSSDLDLFAGPTAVALGDVNADGRLDIVTANNSGGTVSVLLGGGDGSFAGKGSYACGKRPQSVALADLNGDGRLDLAAANYDSDTVSVLLGGGDGSFAAKVDYRTGDGPEQVLLGDLDGDGRTDIVAVNVLSGSVSVLQGHGDGTFADPVDLPLASKPSASVSAAALGDVDGDGQLDLVVAGSPLSVLLGKGDGSFAASAEHPVADYSASRVVLGDVNGDGKLDILIGSGPVGILLGRGDGSFAAEVDYPVGGNLRATALGDVNGDGALDIVMGFEGEGLGSGSGLAGAMLSEGDGVFATAAYYPAMTTAAAAALGDLDRDGNLDLVVVGTASDRRAGSVSVRLGAKDGSFAAPTDYPTGDRPAAVALADVDGDGKLDVVTANSGDTTVSVLWGAGDGALAGRSDFASGNNPAWVGLADLDADGRLDLVSAGSVDNGQSGNVTVLLGAGGRTLAAPVDYPAEPYTRAVAIGDLNRDGKLDLVVGVDGPLISSVSVMFGQGDGTFSSLVEQAAAGSVGSLALADLNGDGKLDVVRVGSGLVVVGMTVYLGKGDGSLSSSATNDTGNEGLAVGDVNGDGRLDIAVGDTRPWTTSLFLGQGDGTFPTKLDYAIPAGRRVLGDLDHDGRLDLVVANGSGVSVARSGCR